MRIRTGNWAGFVTMLFGVAAIGATLAGATLIGISPASAFGALAVGESGGHGFSYNYPNESAARARAQTECGGSCQVVVVFQNTCSAFAGDKGSTIYGWAYAPNQEQAKTMALGFCRKEGGTRCEVRVSACESKISHDRNASARNVIGNAYLAFKDTPPAATRVTPPVASNDPSRATFNAPPVNNPVNNSASRADLNAPPAPNFNLPPATNNASRADFGSPSTPIGQRNDPPPRPVAQPTTPPTVQPTVPPVAALELPKPPPVAPISGLPNDGTKRIALVIGNDRYESLPALQKAVNDSRSIGDTLARLGFEVVRVENAPRRTMNQKLVEFTGKIGRGDTAFFFFAGHGVEIRGVNYLLPVDTPTARENEEGLITGEGIPADSILERLQDRGAKVSLMVLDACRENPFKKAGSRGVGATRGLAQMTTPEGVFVLYSAGVGQTALDRLSDTDPNPNSVFTRAFINVLSKPDQSIQSMAKVTQQEVRKLAATVNHPQMPAYYDQILGTFTLAPAK